MASRATQVGSLLPVLGLVLASAAGAETPTERKAREDLERELGQMVEKPPTRVRIIVLGLEDPNYKIEEPAIELDGSSIKLPSAATLTDEGEHLVFAGDVQPGHHKVQVSLLVANSTSVMFSDEGGFKWKLTGEVSFDVYSGIEVQVRITPSRVNGQRDVSRRFKLHLPATPVMLARLDDGKMPSPLPKKPPPPPPPPGPVDAGPPPVVVAAAEPPPKPESEKPEPATSSKKKAPAPPVRRSLPLREPHVTLQPQPDAVPPGPDIADELIDAGVAVSAAAEELDAGPPPVVAEAVDAGVMPVAGEPSTDDAKLYGWLLFGGGALLVTIGLLAVTRKKRSPTDEQ